MKRNPHFLVHISGNQTIVVPSADAGFSGVVKGNETLGTILKLLDKDTTEEEIINTMKAEYDAPSGQIEKDVHNVIERLRKIGAIDG